MKFKPSTIAEVISIEPCVFGDSRGFFMETYQAQEFARAGVEANWVQDNHSGSGQGILRGLHYQIRQVQGKLIRVIVGEIFDVCVDLRKSSPTFGQWVSHYLSAENKVQLWIPPGFAHGFYVTSDWAEVVYKTTDYYAPEWERVLLWDDPILSIDWPLVDGRPPLLSAKDQAGRKLSEAELFE